MPKKQKKQFKESENEKNVCNSDRKRLLLLMWVFSELSKKH